MHRRLGPFRRLRSNATRGRFIAIPPQWFSRRSEAFARNVLVATALIVAASSCTPRMTNVTQCRSNSECTAGLVCTMGECRAACQSDRDCVDLRDPQTAGLRCVRNATTNTNECVRVDGGADAGDAAPPDADDGMGAPDALDASGRDVDLDADAADVAIDGSPEDVALDGDAADVPVSADAGAVSAPRHLTPSFGATVTSRRPTLHWELPTGAVGARVEICADRFCTAPPIAAGDFAGSSARPMTDLPPGVWFWRLRTRTTAGTSVLTSRAWPMRVGARSAPVDTHWGHLLDADMDGRADLAVTSQVTASAGPVSVFSGRAGTLVTLAPVVNLIPADTTSPPLYFGYPCVPAGDVNGDGYADLASAAGGSRMNLGLVYAYHGTSTGVPSLASATLDAMLTDGRLGFEALASGDFDADGYGDLAVGALTASMSQGRLVVFNGGPTGLTVPTVLTPPAGLAMDDRYGTVSLAGDVNGDGFADVVVSAAGTTSAVAGNAWVLLGGAGASLFSTTIALARPAGPQFGFRVAGAGDVNGDGYSDVMVSAPAASSNAGRVWVFFGSATGTSRSFDQELVPAAGALSFGYSIAGGGDVNGDGYSDVVIGEPGFSGSTGRISVYLGGPAGLGTTSPQRIAAPMGAMRRWGEGVAIYGDLDGDGLSDVAVGGNDTTVGSAGRIHIYRGIGPDMMTMSPGGVSTATLETRSGGYEFGMRLSSGM